MTCHLYGKDRLEVVATIMGDAGSDRTTTGISFRLQFLPFPAPVGTIRDPLSCWSDILSHLASVDTGSQAIPGAVQGCCAIPDV